MRVEDISAVDMLSTRIFRLDNVSDCGVVENAAALLENSSSELAIIVVVAFMVVVPMSAGGLYLATRQHSVSFIKGQIMGPKISF